MERNGPIKRLQFGGKPFFFLFFRRLYDIIHTSVIRWWELCMNPLDFGFFIRHTDPLFSLKPEPGPGTS